MVFADQIVGFAKRFIYLLFITLIFACSDDGNLDNDDTTDDGGTGTTPDTFVLSAELLDLDGAPAVTLTTTTTLILRARLTSNGSGVAGRVITFAASDSNFANLSGTRVATNEQGIAEVQISGGVEAGTGTFTVATDEELQGASDVNLAFVSEGQDTGSSGNFALAAELVDAEDQPAVTLTSNTSLTLRATLTLNGEPATGTVVTFVVSDAGFASLSGTKVATDSNGVAEITVSGGANAGTGTFTVSTQESLNGVTNVNIGFVSEGDSAGSLDRIYQAYLIPASTPVESYPLIDNSLLTRISNLSPATVLVRLTDEQEVAVANQIVSFDLTDATGLVLNASADKQNNRALTDENGFATLNLSVGDTSGAGAIIVSFNDGKTLQLAFESAGDKPGELPTENYVLAVQLFDQTLTPTNNVSNGNNLTVQATLTNNGLPVSGEIIRFAVSDAQFATLSGTRVATNSLGVASVDLTGRELAGVGTITVDTANPLTGINDINLPFVADGIVDTGSAQFIYETYLVPTSTNYDDYAGITASTITQISSAQPGTLLVQLSHLDNRPVAGSLVTVSLLDGASELATLSNDTGTILTDTNGFATVNLLVTDVSGAGHVQISFDDGKTNLIAFESAGDGNQEPPVEVGTVELLASSVQLASSGSDEIELLALVKDENNNLMSGVEVSFRSDSGAVQIVEALTAENGVARALLNTVNNPQTRSFDVTAFVGDKDDSLSISVAGTSIRVSGNSSIVTGDEVEMSVVLLDSDGNGIPLTNVVIISTSDNSITNTDGSELAVDSNNNRVITTDTTGNAIFRYQALNSGNDVLTAQALGETGNLDISISPDSFVISDLEVSGAAVTNGDVPLSGGSLTLTWQKDGNPHSGEVLFSLTRGAATAVNCADNITAATNTDGNGQICVNFASSDAGPAILTAAAEGIAASFEFEFVAETAHQIDLQASPISIGPNQQKSTISAVVRDKDNNLVKNRPVNFRLYDVSGGEIFPASDVTDSNGLATTVYTSNSVTANEGVIVVACTDLTGDTSSCVNTFDDQGDDNRANDMYSCSDDEACVSDDVKLTVADRELFIALGTGNTLSSASEQDYQKVYSVIVTDADSNPVEGVELSVSAVPVSYREGIWVTILNEDGDFDHYAPTTTGICPNEDIDGDGVLDRIEDVDGDGVFSTLDEDLDKDGYLDKGEDVNHNGVLDAGEDLNDNGTLDLTEDLNGDGTLDIDEDLDNDDVIDVDEDIDGDGNFDLFYEYRAGVCSLDDAANNDLNNDGNLDVGEDRNCNGVLDDGEDLDGDGLLDLTEDLDSGNVAGLDGHVAGNVDGQPGVVNPDFTDYGRGDGRFDRSNEDVDGDGNLDQFNEDIDGDGRFDNVNEDVNGDNELDVIEIDYNNNGVADSDGINEDSNQNGTLEPGNVVAVLGDFVTDENGVTDVSLRYAESFGAWVTISLEVRAKVSGTEYSRTEVFTLPYSAEDTTVENNPPAANLFGFDGNCATP